MDQPEPLGASHSVALAACLLGPTVAVSTVAIAGDETDPNGLGWMLVALGFLAATLVVVRYYVALAQEFNQDEHRRRRVAAELANSKRYIETLAAGSAIGAFSAASYRAIRDLTALGGIIGSIILGVVVALAVAGPILKPRR